MNTIGLPRYTPQLMIRMVACVFIFLVTIQSCTTVATDKLKEAFKNPPDTSKPGVYWYFMDCNLSREAMTKDLESMKEAGISNLIFLEVGIGVPRGPIDFMSEEWQDLYVHAVREAERLGIKILLGAGPGWCGSGGRQPICCRAAGRECQPRRPGVSVRGRLRR